MTMSQILSNVTSFLCIFLSTVLMSIINKREYCFFPLSCENDAIIYGNVKCYSKINSESPLQNNTATGCCKILGNECVDDSSSVRYNLNQIYTAIFIINIIFIGYMIFKYIYIHFERILLSQHVKNYYTDSIIIFMMILVWIIFIGCEKLFSTIYMVLLLYNTISMIVRVIRANHHEFLQLNEIILSE